MTDQTTAPEITSDDKLWGLLNYLINPIIPIVILLMEDKKNRKFLRFHAIQALALFIVELALSIILVGACLYPFYLGYSIYLAIKAYQGAYIEIPVLTDFLRKQNWL